MEEENVIPVLYRLIFGEAAEAGQRGCSQRLGRWAEAFEGWLEERRRVKPSSVRTARLAWGRLLRQCGKMPWEVGAEEIEGHASWMLGEGYSPNTAYSAQGMILDFLRWCGERGLEVEAAGRTAAEVRRLQVGCYERAQTLSREEVEALLGLLRRAESPMGRRDYAFVLARLRLGVPLRYIQRLKWGQVEADKAGAWVRWQAQGERRRLPEEVWEAMRVAMEAAGRWEEMRAEEYIFAPLKMPANPGMGSQAQHWLSEKYQSTNALLGTLKVYGRAAGIADRKLTLNTLRTTAIKLRLEQGASAREMQVFMESRTKTRNIRCKLGRLAGVEAGSEGGWMAQTGEPELPIRKTRPYVEGDGLKHGLYAQRQPPEAVAALLAEDVQGIEEQIVGLRLLARGLLERQAQAKTSQEAAQLGDGYSKAAYRLGELVRAEKVIAERAKPNERAELILQAMDKAAERLGWEPVAEDVRGEALAGEPDLQAADRRLAEEIASLRYVLRNTFRLAAEAQEGREYMQLVEVYGSCCIKLLKLLKLEAGGSDRLLAYLDELVDAAIDEAGRRLGIGL